MSNSAGEPKDKQGAGRRQKIAAVGVAVAATGLFLIDTFVEPGQLAQWGLMRWLQLVLACMATICGVVAAIRKNLPKWHNIFNVGAVTSVVWSLILALFIGPRELTGWNALHLAQLTLLSLAAVSACGVAWFETSAPRKKRRERAAAKK